MKKQKIDYSDRVAILNYFLNLYKHQSGMSSDSKAEFFMSATTESFDPGASYKLRVQQYGEWKTRRISVTPLGDSSGSKSKCFKVIYDDIIVVKIPPSPVRSFKKYLEGIEKERRIVNKLSPEVECIMPRVSTILKRIHPFSRDAEFDPETFETKCIERLKNSPKLQEYLKIDGGFAFFMNLSQYSFLSNVIENMHNVREEIDREILKHGDVLWDPLVFEEKYGSDKNPLFDRMNEIYDVYEREINNLRQGKLAEIPTYKTKEWFLIQLSGKELDKKENTHYPPEFLKNVNLMFKKLSEHYKKSIFEYRLAIKKYILDKILNRNKAMMGGIITNILDLVGRLKDKGVAIRDLKPDNVFVVADWEKNPLLLASPAQYSIGLIDFETAVSFDKRYDNKIEQPLLAGTPSYATPSHLFENTLLENMYGDLSRILLLQDWQAATSMIYNVATGRRLAEKTGKVFPEILKVMQKSLVNKQSMSEVYIKSSRVFWNKATSEFEDKLKGSGEVLKSVETVIPENLRKTLGNEVGREKARIRKQIAKRVNGQKIFKSAKARRNLVESSPETIARHKRKWMKGVDIPKAPPKIKAKIIRFLHNLEHLKRRKAYHDRIMGILEQITPKISVYELLKIMFYVVHKTMYKNEWDRLESTEETSDDAFDIPSGDAEAYDRTIMQSPTDE